MQENVGKVLNRGFDLRASATVWQQPAERSYLSFAVMISRNKNILKEISEAMKSYNEQQDLNAATPENKPVQKYYDGVSMDAIWAMRSLGIDPANGREIYLAKDEDGTLYRTYTYSGSQQVICGDELPKFQGNASTTFEYKGFGLNVVLTYQYGGMMYNSTLLNKVENADMKQNVDRRIYTDRWRKPGDISKYKAISEDVYVSESSQFASQKTYPTSRFVQRRNDLTISALQLSYDFYRHAFVKKLGFERIQLRFNANDIYTFSTIDIERGTSYPFARKFNFALSFTL